MTTENIPPKTTRAYLGLKDTSHKWSRYAILASRQSAVKKEELYPTLQ